MSCNREDNWIVNKFWRVKGSNLSASAGDKATPRSGSIWSPGVHWTQRSHKKKKKLLLYSYLEEKTWGECILKHFCFVRKFYGQRNYIPLSQQLKKTWWLMNWSEVSWAMWVLFIQVTHSMVWILPQFDVCLHSLRHFYLTFRLNIIIYPGLHWLWSCSVCYYWPKNLAVKQFSVNALITKGAITANRKNEKL